MSYQESANEIIRLLLLNQQAHCELINRVEEYRLKGDWQEIIGHLEPELCAAGLPFDGSDCIEGIGRMYLGAAYHAAGDSKRALQHYLRAEKTFSYANDHYNAGIAYIAQGIIYRAQGDMENARKCYARSQELLSGMEYRYKLIGERSKANQCASIWSRLQGMIEEIALSHRGRGSVRLLPHCGVTAAGERVYIVDDNPMASAQADEIFIVSTHYRLLSLRTRAPIKFSFSPFEVYFTLDVRGDSMINAGIRPGDRILVKKQPDVDSYEIAVVLINDPQGPHVSLVKKVRKERNRVYLDSENPTSKKPRVFNGKSPFLQIQGKVVAILEEVG